MNEDAKEELGALYALGLLEGAERTAFEAELRRDPGLRRRVAELRDAAASLAQVAPAAEPPPQLKERILESASRNVRPAAERPALARRSSVLRFPVLLPWAVAACLALAATWTGRLYLAAHSQAALLRDQQRLADLELRSTRNQLEAERIVSRGELAATRTQLAHLSRQMADSDRQIASLSQKLKSEGDLAQFKISVLASMLGNSSQALAVAVWIPAKQEGVLSVSKLPALAKNKDYQLWVIDPQYATPVSGGVFTVDPSTGQNRVNFRATKQVKSIAKFAVSLERRGGVPAPEGPIVLLSQ